ncbi:MAG: PLD nuclease N-terminal domain-containing protein, partial [Alphaproteobacteria bacterium]|nr:PLD nuclease N-terminal domain-containing protein [Alphaproteobacteria bacterium]
MQYAYDLITCGSAPGRSVGSNRDAMFELIGQYWPYAATSFLVAVPVVLSALVILYKRNERAAIAWVGLILLNPIVGSIAYLLLGINRIRRRAVRVRPHAVDQFALQSSPATCRSSGSPPAGPDLGDTSGVHGELMRLTDALATNRLTPSNRITPLV